MEECGIWEGLMWPLQAEGVSDLFHVWEGEKSRPLSPHSRVLEEGLAESILHLRLRGIPLAPSPHVRP